MVNGVARIEGGIAIIVTCCNDCPFVLKAANGGERTCNEPSEMVRKPYARDRRIDNPAIIPDGCILKRRLEE